MLILLNKEFTGWQLLWVTLCTTQIYTYALNTRVLINNIKHYDYCRKWVTSTGYSNNRECDPCFKRNPYGIFLKSICKVLGIYLDGCMLASWV
jgi:hypothetical protein